MAPTQLLERASIQGVLGTSNDADRLLPIFPAVQAQIADAHGTVVSELRDMIRTSVTAKPTAGNAQVPFHDDNAIFWPLAYRSCGAGVHAVRLGTVEAEQGIKADARIGKAAALQ